MPPLIYIYIYSTQDFKEISWKFCHLKQCKCKIYGESAHSVRSENKGTAAAKSAVDPATTSEARLLCFDEEAPGCYSDVLEILCYDYNVQTDDSCAVRPHDTPFPHFMAYLCLVGLFVSYTNYYIAYKEYSLSKLNLKCKTETKFKNLWAVVDISILRFNKTRLSNRLNTC